MPVLVTSKFNEDPIKNEQASLEAPFSHYKSIGNFFRRSRAPNSIGSCLIWTKFELTQDSKFEKDLIKNREKVETSFSPL